MCCGERRHEKVNAGYDTMVESASKKGRLGRTCNRYPDSASILGLNIFRIDGIGCTAMTTNNGIVFVVIGHADAGDNHIERWIAGVYLSEHEATAIAESHIAAARQQRATEQVWLECRHSLPRSSCSSDEDWRHCVKQRCGECPPSPDWADDYTVEIIPMGVWRTHLEAVEHFQT